MKRIIYACAVAIIALFASCDSHIDLDPPTPPASNPKQCDILCTDGAVMDYDAYAESGKKAIGVVFYVNRNTNIEGKGYAVYLWNIEPEVFSDSLGISQGTSADITAYDGNTNTYAIQSNKAVTSPLGISVFDIWTYGQSAYIPSVAQMRLLYNAKYIVNPYIEKCGGTPITDEDADCWYWTSTEVSGQQLTKAWLYSLGSGTMQETPKSQAHKARPIITIMD